MARFPYQTEPLTDFTQPEEIKAYQAALDEVKASLGKVYPLRINGHDVTTQSTMDSVNPAQTQEVVGTIHQAAIEHAQVALEGALETFKTWSKVDPAVRADVLFKAAAILRRRKHFYSALMTIEAGKPYAEADADTAEAIDFLEYYGRLMMEMTRIDDKVLSRRNIERNEYRYIPLGVGVILPPWNFPLAILTGMTTAAVVTGNTVLLKPASTTQVIGYHLVKLLEEAGLPAGVVNFVPGPGSVVGDYLIKHPQVRFISFTGSKEVGTYIYEEAAKVRPGQKWLKRVIAEMGGKDAIIVDDTADLEAAAAGIVHSAFGFSGQKCSACSRAIIVASVYDAVVEKIKRITETLILGDPTSQKTYMGPVNNEAQFLKIQDYLAVGEKEGKRLIGGKIDGSKGYFIEPSVFIDVAPDARLMQEEIFGPILAVCKVKDFTEALEVANNTEYGLTGAVYAQDRVRLEQAREVFHVGNLYFNRKCTGAIVGYQPFGGFNMSGTDSKAGGPEYLVLHMQGQSITEAL